MTIYTAHVLCMLGNLYSEYVMLFAFAHQQWLQMHASMVCLYVHCLSC